MAEDRRDVGLLAVTSADRLNAGWTAAQRARERGLVHAREPRRAAARRRCRAHCGARHRASTAIPATLAWLGAVAGHRTRSLGVEHFGQTGTHRRPLPPLRHRRAGHHRRRRGDRARPADPAPQGPRLTGPAGRGITAPMSPVSPVSPVRADGPWRAFTIALALAALAAAAVIYGFVLALDPYGTRTSATTRRRRSWI